ncbi:MAG: hypothetical protein ACJATI_003505 [Halioglobus sp.]|jgi:hypothetical protein
MEKSLTPNNILQVSHTKSKESTTMKMETLELDRSALKDGEDLYISTANFLEIIKSEEMILPYETSFSFDKYIKQLRSNYQDNEGIGQKTILSLLETSEANLCQDNIGDCSMMQSKAAQMLLPSMFFQNEKSFISKPFTKKMIRATEGMETFMADEDWEMRINPNLVNPDHNIVSIGSYILQYCYGVETFDFFTDQIKFRNKKTGAEKYENIEIKLDYVEIINKKPLLPLSDDEIRLLLENTNDTDLWLKMLPPDRFAFKGFALGTFHDVTKIQIHSLMRETITTISNAADPLETIHNVTKMFRSYLKDPSIEIGLANLKFVDLIDQESVSLSLTKELDIRNVISKEAHEGQCIYSDAAFRYKTIILDDILRKKPNAPAEKRLLKQGIQSIMLVPVHNDAGKLISILEIGSRNKFGVNNIVMIRLEEMIKLMKLMINTFYSEMDKSVDLVIRDHFTSIHPSVEWKFKEVATKYKINQVNNKGISIIDPVKFDSVYPLYGQADIVGSSTLRNNALREDLIFNLTALNKLLTIWLEKKHLFLLESYKIKVEKIIENLSYDFDSSDESTIIDLLHAEIHPLLEELKSRHDELPSAPYAEYISILDQNIGIVYDKRKLYEQSVTTLNGRLSDFFMKEDNIMQDTLPHFFEKYKTDGVEYNIYVGQSLLENDHFSENDLREFRIWQLQKMIDVTQMVAEVSPTLPVPITTAQLIFVYNNELNIKFRMEEKKFDVDGAYNVRYEIIKKRIDKATIKGTNERLTLTGKVAIVYLQEKERREYLEYINFLMHSGQIENNVEELELNKLQGAEGLRALRITVKSNVDK